MINNTDYKAIRKEDGYAYIYDIKYQFVPYRNYAEVVLTLNDVLSFSEKTMLLTQLFVTKRIYNDYNSVFTQSSGDDYDLSKLQISGIYKLDEKTSLQLGIFSNVAGRNIGNGNGLIFAVSKNF